MEENKKIKNVIEMLEKFKDRNEFQNIEEVKEEKKEIKKISHQDGFVLTCWDSDIYILHGFKSVGEIYEKIIGLDWVRMPNGSQIKTSSIAKIQSYEDYRFQNEQKLRHKKGQYLSRDLNYWDHPTDGRINEADIKVLLEPMLKTNEPLKLTNDTKI